MGSERKGFVSLSAGRRRAKRSWKKWRLDLRAFRKREWEALPLVSISTVRKSYRK